MLVMLVIVYTFLNVAEVWAMLKEYLFPASKLILKVYTTIIFKITFEIYKHYKANENHLDVIYFIFNIHFDNIIFVS